MVDNLDKHSSFRQKHMFCIIMKVFCWWNCCGRTRTINNNKNRTINSFGWESGLIRQNHVRITPIILVTLILGTYHPCDPHTGDLSSLWPSLWGPIIRVTLISCVTLILGTYHPCNPHTRDMWSHIRDIFMFSSHRTDTCICLPPTGSTLFITQTGAPTSLLQRYVHLSIPTMFIITDMCICLSLRCLSWQR